MPYSFEELKNHLEDAGLYNEKTSLDDFRRLGAYELAAPSYSGYGPLEPGRVVTNLPDYLRKKLCTVSKNGDDPSKRDFSVVLSLLEHGLIAEDTYATFAASPRGKDAAERPTHRGHFDDYLTRTIRKAQNIAHDSNTEISLSRDEKSITIRPTGSTALPDGDVRASSRKEEADGQTQIELVSYSKVKKQHLDYIWPNYLPRKKLTHWAGNSTEGKSPVLIDLVARITSGAHWPDGTKNTNGPQSVILLSSEDDPNDTIRPRLELAGANLDKVFAVKSSVKVDGKPTMKLIALAKDTEALIAKAEQIPDLALIGVDPITNYLDGVGMNKEEQVRPLLMGLVGVAKRLRIGVVTIGHFNRREKGTDSLQRIMGAAAFHGVARFVFLFGPDPEDDDRYSHVMVQKRGVGADSLRYKTEAVPVTWDKKSSKVIRVVWRGVSKATADDAVDPETPKEKSRNARAAEEVRKFLRNGPQKAKDAREHLSQLGYVLDEQLNVTRVLEAAKAVSEKLPGDDHYTWKMKIEDEL